MHGSLLPLPDMKNVLEINAILALSLKKQLYMVISPLIR